MPFDALRDSNDPGLQPLHTDRLAYGGAIEAPSVGKTIDVPDGRSADRLHAWMMGFLYALLAAGVLAVVYGYVVITP